MNFSPATGLLCPLLVVAVVNTGGGRQLSLAAANSRISEMDATTTRKPRYACVCLPPGQSSLNSENFNALSQARALPHERACRELRNLLQPCGALPAWRKKQMLEHSKNNTEACPFYVIPKLRKMARAESRPIAAQHSYALKELSRRLAEVLQAEVSKRGATAKGSKSVAQKLERFKPRREGVFVTYDVEALCPSIDIDDACKALSNNVPALRSQNGFWASALAFVMRNNCVTDHRDTRVWVSAPSSAPTGTRLMTKYNRSLQRQWLR